MSRSWWDASEMKINRWEPSPDGISAYKEIDVAPIVRGLLQQCADYGLTIEETEGVLEMTATIVRLRKQNAPLSQVLNAADTRPSDRTDTPAP